MARDLRLGRVDFRLLDELQLNCRQSLKDISKKLKVPMSTIHDRVKRLENSGVIKSYSAVLDAESLGVSQTSFVLVSVKSNFPADLKNNLSDWDIFKEIAKFSRVQEVHIVTGEWDLLLKVRGDSVKDIGLFVIEKLRQVPGIDRTQTIDAVLSPKETLAVNLDAAFKTIGES
ncbi:MAG: Lrp/AsnC family transcriptional regulator [Candidatus Micrarchaeia archaeon]